MHALKLVPSQGEVDEARLRREIPPPILERLQRELFNSSLPSGPGLTIPNASTPISSSSSYCGSSRKGHAFATNSVVSRRLGATGSEFSSNGLVSSPGGSHSSTTSGGDGGGDSGFAHDGRGSRRRRRRGIGGGGSGGGGSGGEKWTAAGGGFWRAGEREASGRERGRNVDGEEDDDHGYDDGFADELGSGLSSPPQHRTPPPLPRSRRWAEEVRNRHRENPMRRQHNVWRD